MRACVRLDDRVCSGWLHAEQGLSLRVRARAPPVQINVFFASVINVAYTRFKADKDMMDALLSTLSFSRG